MAQLYEAKLDNFLLNILDISDSQSMVIAQHEFVNTNGAILDPQGLRPHAIRFKAFFFGYGSKPTADLIPNYPNHVKFLQAVSDPAQSHTLVHPKYGHIIGYIRDLGIYHDDTQDYVEIDIEFIQKDIQTSGFITDQDDLNKLQAKMANLLNAQLKVTATDLNKGGFGALVGKTIDNTKSLISQFSTATTAVRTFLYEADTFLNQMDTFLNNVSQPFETISSSVRFLNDVPSRFLVSINSCANRVINSLSDLSNSPASLMNNTVLQLTNLADTITGKNASFFKTKFLTISAGACAWKSGQLMQKDEASSAAALAAETKPTFDVKGKRISATPYQPVMSVTELESMLVAVRQIIQDAILANRANYTSVSELGTMAADLVRFVDTVKLSRRSIKTVTINNQPMMTLLLSLGLPYNALERVAKLNPQIKNTTFTEGSVKCYVR